MNSNVSWLRTRSSKSKNIVHLVFVTKYRRPVFTDLMLKDCEDLMRKTCSDLSVIIHEFGGESDHVHLMVKIPPTITIASIVKRLKGSSSRFLRDKYWPHIRQWLWGRFFWSPSYCCVSCGGASIEKVREYIENQDRPS